jgi:hypothetical protein
VEGFHIPAGSVTVVLFPEYEVCVVLAPSGDTTAVVLPEPS